MLGMYADTLKINHKLNQNSNIKILARAGNWARELSHCSQMR